MNKVKAEIEINAPAVKIWDALTNPAKIIQYTASQLETTWKEDDRITWSGEMQGMQFVNKGQVLVFTPHSQLSFTYWSGMGGDADSSENYSTITFDISPIGDASCKLKYNRSNIPTEMETQVFQSHIDLMLSEIKKISEL
jgi:uncharacterized protein YndB with AHSA1/START domain